MDGVAQKEGEGKNGEVGAVEPGPQQGMPLQGEAQQPGQGAGAPGIIGGDGLFRRVGGKTAQGGGGGEEPGGEPGEKGGGSAAQTEGGQAPGQVGSLIAQGEAEDAQPDGELQKGQAKGGETQNGAAGQKGGEPLPGAVLQGGGRSGREPGGEEDPQQTQEEHAQGT